MATQAVLSFVENGKVKLKIVTGCDGRQIYKLADHLKADWSEMPAGVIYEIARVLLGCDEYLVVMTATETAYKGKDPLPAFYREKFAVATFNPRWVLGSAEYVLVVGQ